MSSADVAASELLGPGSRATYRLQVAGERAQEFAAAIKPKLGPGQRLETIRVAAQKLAARERLGRDVFARGTPEGVAAVKEKRAPQFPSAKR